MNWLELITLGGEALLSRESLTEFVLFGTVLLLTTSAAYISRRSGVFNIALDGTVVIGALFAYLAAQFTVKWTGSAGLLSILAGIVCGIGGGLLFTVMIDWLIEKTGNDIIIGILANFSARSLGVLLIGVSAVTLASTELTQLPALHLSAFADVPILGGLIGDANMMTWIAVLLPLGAFWMMNRTSLGLCLRAAEENPSAMIGTGVSLHSVRLKGMLLSGGVASLAGIACAMGALPSRSAGMLPQGFGYLALVIVFAAGGRLAKSYGFALIFSFLGALPTVFAQLPLPQTLVSSFVYLAALVLMLLHVYRGHRRVHKKVKAQRKTREARKKASM